jgi:beta-lactamase class A
MAELLVMIREGRAVSADASEEMYRALCKIYWDDEALSAIPMTVQAASKQGAVNASRSEVVLVNAPHGDYVFCVITKNQVDESWDADNAGFVLLREVSRTLWEHFEGKLPRPISS